MYSKPRFTACFGKYKKLPYIEDCGISGLPYVHVFKVGLYNMDINKPQYHVT